MLKFFQKLGAGLKKTSDKISDGIKDIVTKRKVDGSLLDELEELLIASDLGVKTSSDIIASFSKEKFDKQVSPQEVKEALAQKITDILLPLEAEFETGSHKPYVVLMAGVNGAGKTTTI